MGRPFSERVAGDEWRREAEAWIAAQLDQHGDTLTGPIEQPRVRPWSTQLTVPTGAGRLWFKANCAGLAFEPRLHDELARIAPDAVDAPYATDVARGWMLTRDRGTTLGDSHEPTVDDWRAVLTGAAALQRAVAGERDRLLATGLPDCSPDTVVDRFDRILELMSGLPDGDPWHVDDDLRARLSDRRSAIVDAVQALAESSLPSTWQHGDIHPWNVFAISSGTLRMFDFGDGQWAHAAELLSVPYGWITQRTTLAWDDVLGGYCDVWGVSRADVEEQRRLTGLTQAVNRAMTWWSALAEANAAEWAEWGEGPLYHLSRVLEA
jgi:hypothetical protein